MRTRASKRRRAAFQSSSVKPRVQTTCDGSHTARSAGETKRVILRDASVSPPGSGLASVTSVGQLHTPASRVAAAIAATFRAST